MVWPVDDVVRLAELFADVALSDPVSAFLLLCGALVMGYIGLLSAYVTVRGLAAGVTPR